MENLVCVRQNPYELRSKCFYSFIEKENIITCPYGHNKNFSEKINEGTYNLDVSSGQDKKFIEDLKIDDYVIIPIEKTKKCIIKKVVSEPKEKTFFNIFDVKNKNVIVDISDKEKKDVNLTFEPKQMYYRDCVNIGTFEYDFTDRFPINSYGNIKNQNIKNFVLSKI